MTAQARTTPGVGVCVDDHETRRRVCTALERGGHRVVARESTLDGLIARCERTSVACVVLYVRSPDDSGDRLGRIRAALGSPSIVLICEQSSAGGVRRAVAQGVDGVVLPERIEEALAPVVADVGTGQVSLPRRVRAAVDPSRTLTARERQILALVVVGLTNAEIGTRLYLAESTIKSHLTSAFEKLGVASRNEAASVVLDPDAGRGLGILPMPAAPIAPVS